LRSENISERGDLSATGRPVISASVCPATRKWVKGLLSPLDDRYAPLVAPLAELFSERALNRARLATEVEWLIFLAASGEVPELRRLTPTESAILRSYVTDFDAAAAAELKAIERETDHDVKAVEYYLKKKIMNTSMADVAEFVHFCCTSEDINNLSYGMMLRRAIGEVWISAAAGLVEQLAARARAYRDEPMLARTHGQAATPTTVGKELAVFANRLERQLCRIRRQEYLGKFNGATGTYSAHVVALPNANWTKMSREFVESMDLTWNPLTTQIEPHDYMAELFADIARFNGILNNLNTDMWQYISLGYFRQTATGSVGSSTMPHKINPIRFENSEANVEVSNALLRVLAENLITSRMQRDLSDSSLLRNVGAALGHSLVAIENTASGLRSVDLDPAALARDLDDSWEVLAEACQSVMRRAGVAEPYERLKSLTRGTRVTQGSLHDFIRAQQLPQADEEILLRLTPASYVGLAASLVDYLKTEGAEA
jgi:adenylosuccinate lyase